MKKQGEIVICDLCKKEFLSETSPCLGCGCDVCPDCSEELHVGKPSVYYGFMGIYEKKGIHIKAGYVCHRCVHEVPRWLKRLSPFKEKVREL